MDRTVFMHRSWVFLCKEEWAFGLHFGMFNFLLGGGGEEGEGVIILA